MGLRELGYDSWFEQHAVEMHPPGCHVARVTAIDRGGGLVRDERGEVPFELAGKLRFTTSSSADLPCVGDWVIAQHHNTGASAVIHGVLPRRTFLRRKCAGRNVDFQMIASNIDIAFIVQSCHYDFNLRRFDRYLVMVNEGGIEPILMLTKTDLIAQDELEQKIASIRQSGVTAGVVTLSNATGDGLDDVRRLLVPGKTYCLLGSSGVGKTTLVNRLVGREAFETKAVSGTGEGIHTTARRQLVVLDQGSMFIDTPGMRELGILASAEAVDDSFGDIHALAANCRYPDCSHRQEPGCAILAAVQGGSLSVGRHENYLKLRKESEFHEMSYVERRKKDKDFGKLVKAAKARLRK